MLEALDEHLRLPEIGSAGAPTSFIVSRPAVWNLPSGNTLYKGDYAEASRTSTRPPLECWWEDGTALPT